MANITPDKMRGLIIPTANISQKNIWKAESSFTEMNPRAGLPKADQDYTNLVLETAGTQIEEIKVETVQGGTPGSGAAFMWAGEDGVNLSMNAMNVMTDWKYLSYTTSPNEYIDFDCLSTSDGSIYYVQEYQSTLSYSIGIRKQTQDGANTFLKGFLSVTLGTTPPQTAKPCITQLKDGSILVAYFDYVGSTEVNLVVWRSYDEGVNWTQVTDRGLKVPLTVGPTNYTIETANLVTSDDSVVLVLSTFNNTSNAFGNAHRQYVSRDQGTTFDFIGSGGATYHMSSAVALPQGQIGIAYISDNDTIAFTKIPHGGIDFGYSDYKTAKEVEVSAGAKTWANKTIAQLSNGKLSSWYQDGILYIVAIDTSRNMFGFQSTDLGDTWTFVSQSNTPGINQGYMYYPQSSVAVDTLKATSWEGRAVVLCSTNRSIGAMYFGGWSTVNFPSRVAQPDRNQFHGWAHNWVANQTPGTSSAWNTSGTGTQALTTDGLSISTTSNQRIYTYQNSVYHDMFYHFRMKVPVGASIGADYINWKAVSTDGAFSYTLNLRFRNQSMVIRDYNTTKATVTIDLSDFYEFLIFQNGVDVKFYYRPWDEKQAKKWTEVSVTLGTQAAGLTPSLVWGHPTLTTSNYQSVWSWMAISEGGAGVPGDVRGGQYPNYGEYIYVNEGLLLTAKESPARNGDVYTIPTRSDYPIENIFPQVALSPRVVWRSQDDTTLQTIAWYQDPVVQATARSLGMSDVIGLSLHGINWKTAILQSWNGSAWDNITTITTSTGLEGNFRRYGVALVANSPGKAFQVHYDELRGWYAELEDNDEIFIVKIKQNTEGVWTNLTSMKTCTIMIDTDYTDPSTLPVTGFMSIMPTSVTIISELLNGGATPGEYAYRLAIPAQSTLEGYFQLGTMIQGNVFFMAPQYQRGRTITHTPNVQAAETMDGMFYSRKLSEGRKTISVSWTEPIDTRTIMSLSPDYWQFSTTSGALPVANYGDVPFSMLGLCRYLANQTPVVYLPEIHKSTKVAEDIQVYNRLHNHCLVRTTGEVSMESVLGEEGVDEMFRVATVNMMEIE